MFYVATVSKAGQVLGSKRTRNIADAIEFGMMWREAMRQVAPREVFKLKTDIKAYGRELLTPGAKQSEQLDPEAEEELQSTLAHLNQAA